MSLPTPETKEQIRTRVDRETVHDLLTLQRFCPVGDPRFQGYEGEYRLQRLSELRAQDGPAYVSASKSIGW